MCRVFFADIALSKAAMYTGQHGMVVGQKADNKVSIVGWGLYPMENTFYYEEILKSMKSPPDRDLCDITEEDEGRGGGGHGRGLFPGAAVGRYG